MFFWVFTRRQNCSSPTFRNPVSVPSSAFEDGTDTGFRNVDQLQFDAGEIPKRTYTIYKSQRKSEIMTLMGLQNYVNL